VIPFVFVLGALATSRLVQAADEFQGEHWSKEVVRLDRPVQIIVH
jgi:hypothetical protein